MSAFYAGLNIGSNDARALQMRTRALKTSLDFTPPPVKKNIGSAAFVPMASQSPMKSMEKVAASLPLAAPLPEVMPLDVSMRPLTAPTKEPYKLPKDHEVDLVKPLYLTEGELDNEPEEVLLPEVLPLENPKGAQFATFEQLGINLEGGDGSARASLEAANLLGCGPCLQKACQEEEKKKEKGCGKVRLWKEQVPLSSSMQMRPTPMKNGKRVSWGETSERTEQETTVLDLMTGTVISSRMQATPHAATSSTIDARLLPLAPPVACDLVGEAYGFKISDLRKKGQALLGKSSASGVFLHAFNPEDGEIGGTDGLTTEQTALFKRMAEGSTKGDKFSVFASTTDFQYLPITEESSKRATEELGVKNASRRLVASTVKRAPSRFRALVPELEGHVFVHFKSLGKQGKGLARKSDFFQVSKKTGLWKGQPLQLMFRNISRDQRETLVVGNRIEASDTDSKALQSKLWYVTFPEGHKSNLKFVLFLFEATPSATVGKASITDIFFVYRPELGTSLGAISLMGSEIAFSNQICSIVDSGILTSIHAKKALTSSSPEAGFSILSSIARGPMLDVNCEHGKACMRALGVYVGALAACVRGDAMDNNVKLGNVPEKLAAITRGTAVDNEHTSGISDLLSTRVAELGDDLVALALSDHQIMLRASTMYHKHMSSNIEAGMDLFEHYEVDTDMAEQADSGILQLSLNGLAHTLGHILGQNNCKENFDALWASHFDTADYESLVMDAFGLEATDGAC